MLAPAGEITDAQGGEDRGESEHACGEVNNRHTDLAGGPVRLARDAHDAANGLGNVVVAGEGSIWAGAPVARDGAIDQSGVFRRKLGVPQTPPLHSAHGEVLDNDVAAPYQFKC